MVFPVYGLKRKAVKDGAQVDDNTSEESTVIRPAFDTRDPELNVTLDSDDCMLN
jgi:hypothetical protein